MGGRSTGCGFTSDGGTGMVGFQGTGTSIVFFSPVRRSGAGQRNAICGQGEQWKSPGDTDRRLNNVLRGQLRVPVGIRNPDGYRRQFNDRTGDDVVYQ